LAKVLTNATQFIVVEAKMGSKLSSGTTNASTYDQAARNVACMAEAIRRWAFPTDDTTVAQHSLGELSSIGFYVIAPESTKEDHQKSLKETSIRDAINTRMKGYDDSSSKRACWHGDYFEPLLERIAPAHLQVLTWEQCIKDVTAHNPEAGSELTAFYKMCLKYL
jgi:hypothetical protein